MDVSQEEERPLFWSSGIVDDKRVTSFESPKTGRPASDSGLGCQWPAQPRRRIRFWSDEQRPTEGVWRPFLHQRRGQTDFDGIFFTGRLVAFENLI